MEQGLGHSTHCHKFESVSHWDWAQHVHVVIVLMELSVVLALRGAAAGTAGTAWKARGGRGAFPHTNMRMVPAQGCLACDLSPKLMQVVQDHMADTPTRFCVGQRRVLRGLALCCGTTVY